MSWVVKARLTIDTQVYVDAESVDEAVENFKSGMWEWEPHELANALPVDWDMRARPVEND